MQCRHSEPLFWRHDLSLEFDRQRDSALDALSVLKYCGQPAPDWVSEALSWSRINTLWVDRIPLYNYVEICPTDAKVPAATSWFCRHYRFIGDPRLWHLNPGDREDLPSGEIGPGAISLAVMAFTDGDADARFEMLIGRIWELIDLQCRRIAQFEDELHDLIKSRVVSSQFAAECSSAS